MGLRPVRVAAWVHIAACVHTGCSLGARGLQPGCTRLQGLLGLRRVDRLLAPRCHLHGAEAGACGQPQLVEQ